MRTLLNMIDRLITAINEGDVEACIEMVAALDEQDLGRINEFRLGYVKDKRAGYVREMVPSLKKELGLVTEVKVAPDVHTLLHHLRRLSGDDEIARRQRFEAMSIIVFSVLVDRFNVQDSQRNVLRDMSAMTALLDEKLISPGSVSMDLYTAHDPDPEKHYRVREVFLEAPPRRPGLLLRDHPLPLRRSRSGIPFVFDPRDKDLFQSVLKIWKQVKTAKAKHDPFEVRDRRAFKFVGLTLGETRRLIGEFVEVLEDAGARIVPDGDNLDEPVGAADVENLDSSRNFRVAKIMVSWNAAWYEFQFTTFEHDVNAEYSIGPENHNLYKLGQAVRTYLPLLFPTWAYQTVEAWDDALLEKLRLRMIQRIGWNLDPPRRKRKAT